MVFPALNRKGKCFRRGANINALCSLLLVLVLVPAATIRAGAQTASEVPPTTRALIKIDLADLMKMKVESVYGASNYMQPVTHAPASVTIVTSEEIRRYGYRTLADILGSVPGLFLTYDRNYAYVGIRGIGRNGGYNDHLLLLVDGHRINDNIYDEALIGTEFPVDVDLIERVEVIRGPSSSIYGSNAFLGVVNVITRQGDTTKGLEISGNLASFGTKQGRLTYGNKLKNGLELLLSTSFYGNDGPSQLYFKEFDSPATNYGIAHNVDDDAFRQAFASVSFRGFTLQGVYGTREKGVPTASFDTVFNDPRNRTTDARGYLDLGYDHKFSNQWEVSGHLSYDESDYHGGYGYDYSPPQPPTLNVDYSYGKWWGAEVQLSQTLFDRHKLTFGSNLRRNYQQVQGNYDANPFHLYLNDRRNSNVVGFYAQDEFSLRKNLILNAGVRYDHYGTFGGTVNPRLALIYSPLEKTTVKFLYGTAFRAPNAYELYYQSPPNQVASPNLRPETIRTFEFTAEQYFGDHLRLAGDVFQNRAHDLIDNEVNADGLSQFRNVGSVVVRGMEAELEGKWPSGVRTRLSYTLEPAHDPQTGNLLVDSPRQMAKFNLILPLFKRKVFAGLDVRYFSSRRTRAGNTANGFVLPNLTLFSMPAGKGLELSASIYNLFDTKYGYPGGDEHVQDVLYQDGRTFRLKLTYTFRGWHGGGK
jgi:outer membrane receptor for ferrienterochelin and colicins